MRRNHPKRRGARRPNLDNFDRVYIDRPDAANVRRYISLPRKTIFINISAPAWARDVIQNYDRVPARASHMK